MYKLVYYDGLTYYEKTGNNLYDAVMMAKMCKSMHMDDIHVYYNGYYEVDYEKFES